MEEYDLRCRFVSRRGFLGSSAAAAWVLSGNSALRSTLAVEAAATQKQLKLVSEVPYNAEPGLERLVASRITPLENFFVRCHGPVPQLDASQFRLSVEGLVHRPLSLNLAELRSKFPQHTVEATLTCAGNRRVELNALRPVAGVAWNAGAIGNAEWLGAALADVLAAAEPKAGAKHVWFEAVDPIREKDGSVAPFGGSIPIEKALILGTSAAGSNGPGALIATSMNGQPLLPEHGFPFRTVVPGYIGARSVKWLGKIVVSDRPSPNHYVADAYKLVQTDAASERAAQQPIYEYLVNGAVGLPSAGSRVKKGELRVAGYALPAGTSGSTIQRVEVSTNGGQTWTDARLDGSAKPFCWQLWSAVIAVSATTKQLTVRVHDSVGNVQPEVGAWNLKGYLYNGWHHVPLTVDA